MITPWFRQNAKDFGVVSASRLLWRVVSHRAYFVTSNAVLPQRVECPVCGWRGRRFLDYMEMGYRVPNCACPRCDSHPRHRALFLWLRDEYGINERAGHAIVFAPERSLTPIWTNAQFLHKHKIDIETGRGVDVLGDIMWLPFATDVIDLIWCHHVLEQVPDDGVALGELHRVLKHRGGVLVVSVTSDGEAQTREFGKSIKELSGNRRVYGTDFIERLRRVGFEVTPFGLNLSDEKSRTYGLTDETFFLCHKVANPEISQTIRP
jgi:SAM-dependent methyltransferase